MGCASCKIGPSSPSIHRETRHEDIKQASENQRQTTTVLNGNSVKITTHDVSKGVNNDQVVDHRHGATTTSSPSVPLAASVPSTAASPHHSLAVKKEAPGAQLTPLSQSKTSDAPKDSSKLASAMKAGAAGSKVPSLQVTPDPSSMVGDVSSSPKSLLGRKTSGSLLHRDLSSCRLKKSQDITEVYEISANQVLGTGISGAVRVAKHKLSGRQFAIKTLSLESVGAKKAAMLHNEVSIYLKLDHPNIARLIEVYETEKNIHLVMELCTGGELYDRLAAKKKYRETDAATVTRQMLSAINYCHQHRICHRDLKLENWVYAEKSEDAPLKLIDFGFSRIFNPGVPMTAMHGTVYYVSPEVMDGCYQEKCDIWSIGVIVYMLLSGSPPFNGSYDHEILVKIKRGHFSFSGPRWQGISDQAKQFITYLLQKDPDIRPSAEDALKHPWLQQQPDNDETNDIDLDVVKSMRDFALGNVLRRAAMAVVALEMSSSEVEELEKAFRALDKSSRGTIQLQDLANVLKEKLNIDKDEAQRIFERLDQTGSREVHYSEFIASTLQAKIIKNDNLIREAFQRFDLDKKQAITLDNLRSVIGDTYNGSRVEEIMDLCDANGDGAIDFDEFYKALTSDEAALADTRAGSSEKQTPSSTGIESPNYSSATSDHVSRHPSTSDLSSHQSTNNGKSKVSSIPTTSRESAFTALQSMRKATCLSAVSESERRSGSYLWDTHPQQQDSNGSVLPPS